MALAIYFKTLSDSLTFYRSKEYNTHKKRRTCSHHYHLIVSTTGKKTHELHGVILKSY